ncbi:MAG: FkbM family methyltransferase, partial [Propylenella sp.]
MTFRRQARRIAALPGQFAAIARHPLNRAEPFRALWRWLRWQVLSRALGPQIVPFVGDTVLYGESGLAGVTGNVYYGLAEYEDMLFVLRLLRPGDLFVDVGANVGSYTVLASGVAGSRTHAFEPIERAFDVLGRNVRVNGIEQLVTLHRAAVGSRKGTVVMSTEHDTMNKVLDGESPGVTVPLVALSDTMAGLEPVLIKIDVEGYEAEVLAGAEKVLR